MKLSVTHLAVLAALLLSEVTLAQTSTILTYSPVITSTEVNSGWVYLLGSQTSKELTWEFREDVVGQGGPSAFGLSGTLYPTVPNTLLVRPLDYVDEISIENTQAVGSVANGSINTFRFIMGMPDIPSGYEIAGNPKFEIGRGAFADSTFNYFKPLQVKDVATGLYVAPLNQLVVQLDYGKEYELAYEFRNLDVNQLNVKNHCRYWIKPNDLTIVAVPESQSILLGILSCALIGTRRRRR